MRLRRYFTRIEHTPQNSLHKPATYSRLTTMKEIFDYGTVRFYIL